MAGTAYHMEALRRQRVLERKAEAVKRIEDTLGQSGGAADLARDLKQSQLVFSEPGQYAQNRICHRRCRAENEGEDKVMPLLHPTEYNFVVPMHKLPPRKPHFKV